MAEQHYGNGKHNIEAAVAAAAPGGKKKNGNGHGARAGMKVKGRKGLRMPRRFTQAGVHPFDQIEWDSRLAQITGEGGEIIFEQKDVEVPKFYSQLATNVVVSKYFRGQVGTIFRERSVKQLVGRVVDTLTKWGIEGDYFATADDAETFRHELAHILVHQKAAFNSPVWFNLGVEHTKPQCSACFIQSVKDDMTSIMDLAKSEVMLFKYGSGTGSNLSKLRSSREHLSGGGIASGPVSFMKGYDAFAGAIKSGGKTRRAAKMVILDVDHPDILQFINCKADEEKKAWALIEAGYDAGFNVIGGAYDSISFQNANHSVRVSDDFMHAAQENGEWWTRFVTSGQPAEKHRAREIIRQIAESTWICGDPGIQFDTTINDWHACANTDRIYASNPCSEYMFLDDSACNLASINLMKFRHADGEFDVEAYEHAIDVLITAMEIIVDSADYPTDAIAKNSHDYRPLGLGYANLGALLMAQGAPYDSEKGRAICGALTALLTGRAYRQSAVIASHKGAFPGYEKNRQSMLRVIRKHRAAVDTIHHELVPDDLMAAGHRAWDEALELGEEHGYRNSQATVIAPTGTIAFMMDCDTTGIEPDIALIKYKKLVGGGLMKIINQTVPEALRHLGYSPEQIEDIVKFTDENGSIEGAPHLKDEHLQVFDCAFRAPTGTRAIHYMGHLRMMAAAQPFISGAISKTVNVPEDITVDELAETYIQAWKLGLKAVAIYRDGCKRSQPLSTSLDKKDAVDVSPAHALTHSPVRRRLPDERQALTHKFNIAGHEGYITVGLYEDGQPGELFITMSKQGSTISGLMDSFATSVSIALQYGVPLRVLVQKFIHSRFEPAGFTGNPEVPVAKSIMDYIFRWLALKFLTSDEAAKAESEAEEESKPMNGHGHAPSKTSATGHFVASGTTPDIWALQTDAPPCHLCGAIMIRAGACYACTSCGETSGCG